LGVVAHSSCSHPMIVVDRKFTGCYLAWSEKDFSIGCTDYFFAGVYHISRHGQVIVFVVQMNPREVETITILMFRIKIYELLGRGTKRALHVHADMPDVLLAKFALEAGAETLHIPDDQPRSQSCSALNLIGARKVLAGPVPVEAGQKAV